ncbi:MAG TPA: HYR domain-containing protein [Candidatus Saccharimonadales bacterium]|nr:HYR domain-containing protein [Candidatus Saccharimonadales bacterium]
MSLFTGGGNNVETFISPQGPPKYLDCLDVADPLDPNWNWDDLLVMHPATIHGDITLCGPSSTLMQDYFTGNNAPNAGIMVATTANGGLYDHDFWYNKYCNTRAFGGYEAGLTTDEGTVYASLAGSVIGFTFFGSYDYRVAGLNNDPITPTTWRIGHSEFWIARPGIAISEPDLRDGILIDDRLAANRADPNQPADVLLVTPHQTYTSDRGYCLGQVTLLFKNEAGLKIMNPTIRTLGGLGSGGPVRDPLDPSQFARYDAETFSFGPPRYTTFSTTDVPITIFVPAGVHTVHPQLTFQDNNNVLSTAQFPTFSMEIGCRDEIGVMVTEDGPGPIPRAGTMGPCYPTQADAEAAAIAATSATTTCMLGTLMMTAATAGDCSAAITVTVTDGCNQSGTVTYHTRIDTMPPVLTGCQNVTVPAEAGESGATVSFTVTAMDNCDGSVQPLCHPPSGSFFNTGCTEVTCAATDLCDNQSACAFTVCVLASSRAEGCSLTQGFYGNPKGKFNGTPSLTLLNSLLSPALVVGKLGGRSLSISASSALLLQQRLPAGGPSTTLPNSGDQNLPTAVLALSKGRFANILLGQTITLALNVRLDANLPDFPLPASFCTQGTLPGPDSRRGTSDDTVVSGDFHVFAIPTSVLMSLSDASLGIMNVTVEGLLELANRGLAGLPTGSATLADISAAVDAINRGFDECRVLVDCVTHVPVAPSPNDNFGNPIILGNPGAGGLFAAPKVIAEHASVAQIIRTKGFSGAASKEPGEPDIAGNLGGKSIWWRWSALDSGWVSIETAGSSFDTLLAVYVGQSLSNLTLTASSDDTATLVTAEVAFHATAGTNYLIAVDGYDGASGDVTLQLVTGAPRLGPVLLLPGGGLRLGIEGQLGRSYTIESSGDLTTWTTLAVAENSNGFLQFTDPDAGRFDHRFYRVVLEP